MHETTGGAPRRTNTVVTVLAALSAGAGLIHLVLVPPHLAESAADGAGFLAAAAVQLALAVALATRPSRAILGASIAANAVLLGAWALSRTRGLPYGSHAGHPADASFVDLVCVGLEVAVVLGAAALLLRTSLGAWVSPVLGAVASVAVLALAGTAIASPSARDHVAAAHGDHGEARHDGAHAEVDDRGLSQLQNGHQHETGEVALDPASRAALTAQLARTIELVLAYPTVAAAEAAGYRRAGPFAPGLGTHYQPPEYHLNADGVIDGDDILAPLLIFDGTDPGSPIAGFMYVAYGTQGEPEGFVGPNDHWHYHERVCIVVNENGQIDTPFGADIEGVTEEMCTEVGGSFIENTGYMVHVWTVPGYESPLGVFSEINPRIDCPDGTYHQVDIAEVGDALTTCRNAA